MDLNLTKNWAEILFFLVMVVGAIVGLTAPSAAISYFIIVICGLYAGRIIYKTHNILLFPFILAVIGFLIGFVFVLYDGNRVVVIILFVIAMFTGFKIYQRKYLTD